MKQRELNGYILIHDPEHPKAMKSENWDGWVYEHIAVAERDLGRPLRPDEEVHHLDFNRRNNNPMNLLVLPASSHKRLHYWLDKHIPNLRETLAKDTETRRCEKCEKPLTSEQRNYCSQECYKTSLTSILDSVTLDEIIARIKQSSVIGAARTFGLSDNGLRKHLKSKYKISNDDLKYILTGK